MEYKYEILENEILNPDLVFPHLIRYFDTGNIVLITGDCGKGFAGVLLHSSESEDSMVYYGANWSKFGYELFRGKITLSN